MPRQWVIRPQTAELPDYRGYAGRVISGTFKINDKITILPSGASSTISKIEFFNKELAQAEIGQSVTIHLADDVDISRDMIVNSSGLPEDTS